MLTTLEKLSRQRLFWLLLLLLGLALEAGALYYQYVLDEWPCVLCIHVRIWVVAMILVGLLGLLSGQVTAMQRILHLLNIIVAGGLAERSYQVLAVERGWVFGDCAMDLGMPAWFALDQWAPWLFEVQTSCGYTPYILFDITMAEVLMGLSALLLLAAIALATANWFGNNNQDSSQGF